MSSLNEVALGLAEQLRGKMLEEIVDLDVRVAQKTHEFSGLRDKARQAENDARFLEKSLYNRKRLLESIDADIRELKRPREGFPDLNDDEYGMRMIELRASIQGAVGL